MDKPCLTYLTMWNSFKSTIQPPYWLKKKTVKYFLMICPELMYSMVHREYQNGTYCSDKKCLMTSYLKNLIFFRHAKDASARDRVIKWYISFCRFSHRLQKTKHACELRGHKDGECMHLLSNIIQNINQYQISYHMNKINYFDL